MYVTHKDITIELDLLKDVQSSLLPTNSCIQKIKREYGIDVANDESFIESFVDAVEDELNRIRVKFMGYQPVNKQPRNIRLFNVLGDK